MVSGPDRAKPDRTKPGKESEEESATHKWGDKTLLGIMVFFVVPPPASVPCNSEGSKRG